MRFLYSSRGEPRLVVPGLVVLVTAFVLALALITFVNRPRTDEERALSLLRSGKAAQAERIYARLVRERPTVPLVLALVDAHERAQLLEKTTKQKDDDDRGPVGMGLPDADAAMNEVSIDLLLSEIPPELALVARYSRGVQHRAIPLEVAQAITEGANREPPMPWANHLLAREAERSGKLAEAAELFEKEGVRFHERRSDVDASLRILIRLDAWEAVRERLFDPRVSAAASAHVKYRVAVHDRNWRAAIRWLPAIWAPELDRTGVAMTAVTALGWAFFCARLGKMSARIRFRLPMYAVAFVLGIASVLPTVLLIAVEEARFGIVETGDAARDVLFFVFGVGLREEASKLLMFLPLLPLLRRYGDKLDVLVCGAMVGLGFATEENLNYLAQENLHTGLGRFLTANFFHMALTGTLASALDDFLADREKNAQAFMRTSLFVVAIHGAYDFLLSHNEYGGTYLAMTAFVFLTRLFLEAVDTARRRADRGITPLHAFIGAVAVVTGVSLAYAVVAVGPQAALVVMGGGLLGEAVIVYVFVRTLHRM